MIAGYETVRTHIDEIARLDFSCIFVDEAHRVKNPRSSTTAALMQLPCHIRFGLTGTAMQNRYAELHTVLNWCFPNKLGDPAQWKDYVETPLKDAQKRDATQQQLAIGRASLVAMSFSQTVEWWYRLGHMLWSNACYQTFSSEGG